MQNSANEYALSLEGSSFEKTLVALPLASYRAGETVLKAGSKTGRLLFLKSGAVVILKDAMEIARVDEPGVVFGDLSALLDLPHTAEVRALKDSVFHVADAAMLGKDPTLMFHVARILARRLVATNRGLVELKKHLQAGQSPGALRKIFDRIEEMLSVSGSNFEQWI
jgi:CRP/FNR family transcriptional regulator, cyclic AMP receptor protein